MFSFPSLATTGAMLMNISSRTVFVRQDCFRGFQLDVTCTDRTGSPLMDREFMVFVGNDMVGDEFETEAAAYAYGRNTIERSLACRV